jgi:hypothetical protein
LPSLPPTVRLSCDLTTMSKTTLAKALVDYFKNSNHVLPKSLAFQVTDAVFAHIAETLKSAGRFAYPGFGAFRIKCVSFFFFFLRDGATTALALSFPGGI